MITAQRTLRITPVWSPADHPPIAELLNLVHEGWRSRAACRDAPWQLFEPGEARLGARQYPQRARRAVAFCHDCPVRDRCGEEGDLRNELGVWGGTWRAGQGKNYRVRQVPPDFRDTRPAA